MALIVAAVISARNLPLCLMLMILLGYFLFSGFQRRYEARDGALTVLLTSIVIEIYGIFLLDQDKSAGRGVEGFLKSVWPDVLLFLAAALYYLVLRSASENEERQQGKWWAILWSRRRPSVRLQSIKEWWGNNSTKVVRHAGGAVIVLSLGLFVYYVVSIGTGMRKIPESIEEVYILEHYEDHSLALTVSQDPETGAYRLSFEKYTGSNNQKVNINDVGDDTFQLKFLEPDCTLEVDSQMRLHASPDAAFQVQFWVEKSYYESGPYYRIICSYGLPLSYGALEQGKDLSGVFIGNRGSDYEIFAVEKTVSEEFVTRMVVDHGDEFMPTTLMETLITIFGGWIIIPCLLITIVFIGMIYLRRVIGDKLAALYALLYIYMLAYAALSAVMLLLVGLAVQCYCVVSYKKNGYQFKGTE